MNDIQQNWVLRIHFHSCLKI